MATYCIAPFAAKKYLSEMVWNYIGVCVIQQQSNRNFVSLHGHVISSINFLVKHKTSNVTLKKYIIRTQTGSPSYLAWYS